MNTLIVAAVVVPVVALASTVSARALGRWFAAALKASMEAAVADIVKPHLDRLGSSLATLRAENAADHADVQTRLEALEQRVAAVESRLP